MSHTKEEVLQFMRSMETASIATSTGAGVRQRMMHIAVDDDFSIYVSSMKGDPKIIQWTNVPETAILIHKNPGDFLSAEEVEVIGRASILQDQKERERAIELIAPVSPIVGHMQSVGALDRLDFIKITPTIVKYRLVAEIMQGVPPTVFDYSQEQESSGWEDLKGQMRAWKEAVRPLSLTGSVVSVLLGGALAYAVNGAFDWGLFILTLLGAVMIQAGTNMINDWKDAENGTDDTNREYIRPFTGGSRVIQMGLIRPGDLGFMGIVLSLTAFLIGVYLVTISGLSLLLLVLYGLIAGVFYTGGTGKFSFIRMGTGIAEFLVATTYGVLIVMGTYFVQAGQFDWHAFLVSIPVSLLITNVLVINQFQDAEADGKVGKLTLVVRVGKKKAVGVLTTLFLIAYLTTLILPLFGLAPFSLYLVLLSVPFTWNAIRYAWNNYDKGATDLIPSNAFTAIAHLTLGLLMTLGYLYAGLGTDGVVYLVIYAAIFAGFVFWVWNYIERQRRVMESVKAAFKARTKNREDSHL